MASIIWSSGISGAPTVELVVNQQSQDVAGNYSVLSWSLILHRPYNVSSSASKSYNVKINNVTVASGTTTIGGSGDKTIASGTTTVYHNADGTKTGVPLSFYMDIGLTWSGSGTGNASGSGTMNLTTIPRASTGSMSNMSPNLGDAVTINIARASTAFTHDVFVDWYDGFWTKLTTGGKVATSLAWTVPKSFAEKIPSQVFGGGRIKIDTYNGTSLIGSTIFNFTGNVPDTAEFKPTISAVSRAEAVAGLATQFGAYVQDKSKLTVAITASGAYLSTIANYKTTILGVDYSGQTFTSGLLSASGTVNVVTTVTDSRGRTATVTNTVTVVAYSPPTIEAFSGFRSLSTGVQDDDDGTYLRAIMKFKVSPVNVGGVDKNTKSYKVEYKLQSEPTTWTQETTGAVFDYDSAFTSSTAILNADFAYDIRLTVSDWFGSAVATFQVGSAFTLLDFSADGRGMAIGKVYEGLRGAILELFGDFLIQNRGLDTKLLIEQLQGNAGIEVGNKDLAGLSYIDFHSSGLGTDYDARIIASGGTAELAKGLLSIYANQMDVNASIITFLSTPTIAGNALWHNGNIEKGQNANGFYIKFPDGTLLCWRTLEATFAITNAWGSLFYGPTQTWTFPVAFVGDPIVMASSANSQNETFAVIPNTTVNNASIYLMRPATGINGVHRLRLFAIGRWKA